MRGKLGWRMALGLALDLAGVALILVSLPEGGALLAIGAGCVLAGALTISKSLSRPGAERGTGETPRTAQWRPEPELQRPPPRPVRLSPGARVVAALWAVMLVVAGAFFHQRVWLLNPAVPSQALIEEAGVKGRAAIHRRQIRENAAGEPKYYLYYNFTDSRGEGLRASVRVGRGLYERYRVDDALEVVYLPADPLAHFLPEITRRPWAARLALAFGALMVIFGAALEVQRRRFKRLVVHGAAAPGVVESVTRRGAAKRYAVRYKVGGRAGVLKATQRHSPVEPSDVVTVLYVPDKPENAIIYQAGLYRAVR